MLNGTGLDTYEINAVAATLNFILHNSVEFHVSDIVLNKELIDLGLPKENVESITKSYKASREKLLEKALDKMPKGTHPYNLRNQINTTRIQYPRIPGFPSAISPRIADGGHPIRRAQPRTLNTAGRQEKSQLYCHERRSGRADKLTGGSFGNR